MFQLVDPDILKFSLSEQFQVFFAAPQGSEPVYR